MIDLSGKQFGRLTAVKRVGTRDKGYPWLCQCSCGKSATVTLARLRSGKTKSCGCLRKELSAARGKAQLTRHGMKGTLTWNSWSSMMARGRAIRGYYAKVKVHERWHLFENFLKDMGERPSRFHSIDRYPNNQGDYEPGNCRWATKAEQANNRKDNR